MEVLVPGSPSGSGASNGSCLDPDDPNPTVALVRRGREFTDGFPKAQFPALREFLVVLGFDFDVDADAFSEESAVVVGLLETLAVRLVPRYRLTTFGS